MSKKLNLRKHLTFGFEQTLTTPDWWNDPGFTSTSDTPLKREKMLDYAKALAAELGGDYKETKDIWKHMQYEVMDKDGKTQFYVTMDPGSIELKTPPCFLHECEDMARPIFAAAEKSGIVAYRNWWYGVKAGTEGGCHVNFGGMTDETNPLIESPELVVKYAAYIHNRPFLHYPFMGLDVGPEGNAMRMDEKDKFFEVQKAFDDYRDLYKSAKCLAPQETYDFFKETNLIAEKASYPSLYKFKDGLFLIEDRGQEALREAEDFFLVAQMRMHIFEHLMQEELPEQLEEFPDKHDNELTSLFLWDQFKAWAPKLDLNPEKFKRFFDRQWPLLSGGENIPEKFTLHDGRRPRIITDITKRGDVVVSKTIDTTFKRFELITNKKGASFKIEGAGLEKISGPLTSSEGFNYQYFDIHYDKENADLKITLEDKDQSPLESKIFNANDMMWK